MDKINIWLDQKNIVKYPSNKQISYSDKIDIYYTKKEIQKFSKNIDHDSEFTYEYNDNGFTNNPNKYSKIYIPENTRRYEADNLFKNLVNDCIKYNILDIDNKLLFSSSNKNSFYNFIYENSSK
jgi:hypothetical protein